MSPLMVFPILMEIVYKPQKTVEPFCILTNLGFMVIFPWHMRDDGDESGL